MSFMDGFCAAVPSDGMDKFRDHAAQAAKIFLRHGALRVVECWGEDVPHGEVTDFHRAVQAKEGETVVFSWIEWPDKAARDAGMAKAFEDMPQGTADMPFDGKRMIYGGFRAILDER